MAQATAPAVEWAWRRETWYPDGEGITSKYSAPRTVTVGGSKGGRARGERP